MNAVGVGQRPNIATLRVPPEGRQGLLLPRSVPGASSGHRWWDKSHDIEQ